MSEPNTHAPMPSPIGPGAPQVDTYWRRCAVRLVDGAPNWDGDTLYIRVDLGMDVQFSPKLRLSKVDAPELKTGEPGNAARAFATGWVRVHALHIEPSAHGSGRASAELPFLVRYDGWDLYGGRIDGRLVCGEGHCLNDDLVASLNARRRGGTL